MRLLDVVALLLGASSILGCRSEEPRPIDPLRTEREFRLRTLGDPGLRAWVGLRSDTATTPFPPERWDLKALTLVALYFHPDLDVALARLEAARGSEVTAAAIPNPTLGGGLKHNFDLPAGASPWTYELALDWTLQLPGKRRYRREEARQEAEAARLEAAEAAWRVYRDVRDARISHLLAARREGRERERVAALESSEAILRKKLERGAVPRILLEERAAEASEARGAAIAAAGRKAGTLARLARALGLPLTALDGVRLSSDRLDAPPAPSDPRLQDLQARGLWNRLDIRRLLAEYAAAEAALQKEILGQYPDLRLGPGYEWEEGDKKFTIGASMDLPIFDRNQGRILEAMARRKELGARFVALQAEAIGEIDEARLAYVSALKSLEEADRAMAALEAADRATRKAVDLGAEEPLELALSGARLAAAEVSRTEVLERAWTALSRVEDAVGRSLEPTFLDPEETMARKVEERREAAP